MDKSILTSIKKMLGIDPDYDVFDVDIIIAINSYLMALTQLGLGPPSGFSISGAEETWDQFLQGRGDLNAAKSYLYLRVKMQFDPPTSSFVMAAMKEQAAELEWRCMIQAEPMKGGDDDGLRRDRRRVRE